MIILVCRRARWAVVHTRSLPLVASVVLKVLEIRRVQAYYKVVQKQPPKTVTITDNAVQENRRDIYDKLVAVDVLPCFILD